MKTFESYIDDFDIDTPASEVAKDIIYRLKRLQNKKTE